MKIKKIVMASCFIIASSAVGVNEREYKRIDESELANPNMLARLINKVCFKKPVSGFKKKAKKTKKIAQEFLRNKDHAGQYNNDDALQKRVQGWIAASFNDPKS